MPGTLRVDTNPDWTTKPAADEEANKLTQAEVDGNFLFIEDALQTEASKDPTLLSIGTMEVREDSEESSWLLCDGSQISPTTYPDLVPVLGQTIDWSLRTDLPDVATDADVSRLATSPDGSLVAFYVFSNGTNTALRVVSTVTNSVVFEETYASGGFSGGLSFSPDGSMLAGLTTNVPNLVVWNTTDWSLVPGVPSLDGTGPSDVKFSPDGQHIACLYNGTPELIVLEVGTWTQVSGTPDLVGTSSYFLDYSPDSSELAVGVSSFGVECFYIYDTSTWAEKSSPSLPTRCNAGTYSPDGNYFAVSFYSSPYFRVYETSGWTTVKNGDGLADETVSASLSFSRDSAFLAYSNRTYTPYLRVYDANDNFSLVTGTPTPPQVPREVAFGKDATLFVTHDTDANGGYIATEGYVVNLPNSSAVGGGYAWKIKAE